jgi:hypothetical protein
MHQIQMKKPLLILLIISLVIILAYVGLKYLSNAIGWYGYKKWEHRIHSTSIAESKKRGVFVKSLNYRIEGMPDTLNFEVYIEKGFRYGHHTSDETVPVTDSKFPYQLSFNNRPTIELTISISENDLAKFDSANLNWGFLKAPALRDTILLWINGYKVEPAQIKVWQ